jgi:thiamine-monophosphate kinase
VTRQRRGRATAGASGGRSRTAPVATGRGGEDELLAWLAGRLAADGLSLIGDDAALLPLHDGKGGRTGGDRQGDWAVTVDSQIAGTHFPPDLDSSVVARRLLAVNLSDLAAIGAEPVYALLALNAPPGFDHRRFLGAFADACRAVPVTLAGGDLARAPLLVATATLIGRRRPGGRWLRRDAARAGDELWVGGTLGESALGRLLLAAGARMEAGRVQLPPRFARGADAAAARRAVRRHLLPTPQLALSAALANRRRCACLDVSDGLARDLGRLVLASGVGATVEATALPVPARAASLAAALGADATALALGGGEDYVLLCALPPGATPPAGLTRIGVVDTRPGLRLRGPDGEAALPELGWDHLAGR